VSSNGSPVASGDAEGLAASDPPACTSACTSEPKTVHTDPVADLAAALSALSADDRARLAALLLGQQPEQDEADRANNRGVARS
jgi:hypothetical protein